MDNNFNTIMNNAIKRCEGKIIKDDALNNNFYQIYPFTTENINGYIDKFDLNNKSLLTVGSSADQAINAILNGCLDVTVLDINPYTKFYYYLKTACILNLELDEFFLFLRFYDFPKVFKNNKDVFNRETYNKIKSTLRLLDYESYLFWDELFHTFYPTTIRSALFSYDEDRTYVIKGCNKYLQDKKTYYSTREKLQKIKISFINQDIFKANIEKTFDNIWLSNIGTYLKLEALKTMIDKISKSLNNNGNLLISYLYKTTIDTKFGHEWQEVYNLEKTFAILKEYDPFLFSFTGTEGLKFKDDSMKDSCLILKKILSNK